jgi:hypothetical protein
MSDHETDPAVTERLAHDPLDQMESDEDEDKVERAWDDTEVDEGDAPTS